MKKLIICTCVIALMSCSAYAGPGPGRKKVVITPKSISSYQRLKTKYKASVSEAADLREQLYETENELFLAENSLKDLRDAPPKVVTETKTKVIIDKQEVEVVPWYYWLGLAVAILL